MCRVRSYGTLTLSPPVHTLLPVVHMSICVWRRKGHNCAQKESQLALA